MATWEDGPEYAPLERPAEFTSPRVDALDIAPPAPRPPMMPDQRPVFSAPSGPVPPLAALVPAPVDDRNPETPFAVVSSTLTAGSAWGSAHQPAALTAPAAATFPSSAPQPAPFAPYGAAPAAAAADGWPLPAPTALPTAGPGVPAPWPPSVLPTAPPPPAGYPARPFPAPGTPQWFAPGVYGEHPGQGPVGPRQVWDAATPGLLLVLGVGALVFVLSPIMLVIAFVLADRVLAGRAEVRRALGIALASLGFFGLVGLTRAPVGFGDWWSFVGLWGLLTCWVMVGTVSLLVYRALRRGTPAPPAPQGDWR